MISMMMHKIQSVFNLHDVQESLSKLDTLPEMDEVDFLFETRQRLSKIQFESIREAKKSIECIVKIDEDTYRYAKKETYKYLNLMKENKKLATSIYNANYLYYKQLYSAYTQFLTCYQSQNNVSLSADKINLILCRLLNAAFAMAKWRYFDDQTAPLGMWSTVHDVIKLAENLAIMNKNLFVYNFHRRETSIAAILKIGFMMDTLHRGNYSPSQIQLTEEILKMWSSNPVISNNYRPGKMQFFIVLQDDKGPERIRTVEKYEEYRFWKTIGIVDRIKNYLCAVDTNKSLVEFGLEKIAPVPVVVKLFKKLCVDWCAEGYEPQRRKEARQKNCRILSVNYDLPAICNRLKAINADDLTQHLVNENWLTIDESSKGFAVDLGKDYSSWIEHGRIVGCVASDATNNLIVAEIKNIKRQANGNYKAGLELLGTKSEHIRIARIDSDGASEVQSGYFVEEVSSTTSFNHLNAFSGILITDETVSNNRNLSLIMPRSEYKRDADYLIQVNGVDRVLKMHAVARKQRDWVSVAITINFNVH